MAHESVLVANSLHDVMKNLCEDANDAIALVVRVPIVELFEMIEVGVARREMNVEREPPADLGLDLDGAGEPSRRVDVQVSIRAPEHRVEANLDFARVEAFTYDFVGAGPKTGVE